MRPGSVFNIRKQRHQPGSLDGHGQLPLMIGACPSNPPRRNLPSFRSIFAQYVHILIINFPDISLAKAAELLFRGEKLPEGWFVRSLFSVHLISPLLSSLKTKNPLRHGVFFRGPHLQQKRPLFPPASLPSFSFCEPLPAPLSSKSNSGGRNRSA